MTRSGEHAARVRTARDALQRVEDATSRRELIALQHELDLDRAAGVALPALDAYASMRNSSADACLCLIMATALFAAFATQPRDSRCCGCGHVDPRDPRRSRR